MQNLRPVVVDGGLSGTTPVQSMYNQGEVGVMGKVMTTTAEPHLSTRKLAEDGELFQSLAELARRILANPKYRSRVLEFAKDTSVPRSEKFLVLTFQRQGEPPFGFFVLRARSRSEAQAAARAAIRAEGFHPMRCFSSHLSRSLLSV